MCELRLGRLTFGDGTTDVTYIADIMLFLHATSGELSLSAAFSLRRFLVFYCFKCYLASFSWYKIVFLPNIKPPKQDQIDVKWLGIVFWRESRRVGKSLIIVNKSIKEKFDIFSVRSTCIFTRGYRYSLKYILHLVFIR